MTPFGSISFFVYSAIVVLAGIWKIITTRPLSATIIVIVLMATFYSAQTAFGLARDQGLGLYDYGAEKLFPCRETVPLGKRQVIIRVDEVQAFWLRETTLQLATEASQQAVPLVFGVIPKNILEDTKLVSFLQRVRCDIEIAQNGWDYSSQIQEGVFSAEFQGIAVDDAYMRIESGKSTLKKINGRDPKTFIPPYNIYSAGTALALKQSGIPIISSQGTWKFDMSVAPYQQPGGVPLPSREVLAQCERKFSEQQPCVILFSPKNFSTTEGVPSTEKVRYFRDLLTFLSEHDVTFTTFQGAAGL